MVERTWPVTESATAPFFRFMEARLRTDGVVEAVGGEPCYQVTIRLPEASPLERGHRRACEEGRVDLTHFNFSVLEKLLERCGFGKIEPFHQILHEKA